MNGKILLDTNAVIGFIAGIPSVIAIQLAANECFVPEVVFGELLYGAYASARVQENIQAIVDFRRKVSLLSFDPDIAERYAQIKYRLRIKGRPIPDNDIWIAAFTLVQDCEIVTRDRHFDEVDGLRRVAW